MPGGGDLAFPLLPQLSCEAVSGLPRYLLYTELKRIAAENEKEHLGQGRLREAEVHSRETLGGGALALLSADPDSRVWAVSVSNLPQTWQGLNCF